MFVFSIRRLTDADRKFTISSVFSTTDNQSYCKFEIISKLKSSGLISQNLVGSQWQGGECEGWGRDSYQVSELAPHASEAHFTINSIIQLE